jgi:hypothetical protein
VVDLSGPSAPVTAAVLGDSQGRRRVPWRQLGLHPRAALRLTGGAGGSPERGAVRLGEHEVMLVRDVLDTRVYDVPRRRVVRVGEVWLDLLADGSFTVAGLEVGLRSLLPRLGLRRHAPAAVALLPLTQVHLTSPHGHRVQLATASSSVHTLRGADLAHLLTHLPASAAADVVRELPEPTVAPAVGHLHPHVADRLDHALHTATAAPARRWRRTAGWRLNRPPGDQGQSAKRAGPSA